MTLFKTATLAATLAASALSGVSPATARGYYRHRGGDGAAIGIGAGILGLAVGAAIAGDHRRYYPPERYYAPPPPPPGYYFRDGYYWDREGRRYNEEQWRRNYSYYGDDYRRGYYGDDYYRRGW